MQLIASATLLASVSCEAPLVNYGAPGQGGNNQQYSAPLPSREIASFSSSQASRGASQQYGAPSQSSGSASNQYGAPALNANPANQYGAPSQAASGAQGGKFKFIQIIS